MNDQRNKEIRTGCKVVALIGAGAQMVGTVADIRTDGAVISCELSLAVVPGQPPTVLVLPDDTQPRKPKGVTKAAFRDDANHKIGLGDDICCMMNIGIQVIATIIEFDPGSAGGGVITGVRRGGQAVTQMRSGYIKMAGEFILPIMDGRAPCLYLEKEEAESGKPQELLQ